jgi:hypothetical protein
MNIPILPILPKSSSYIRFRKALIRAISHDSIDTSTPSTNSLGDYSLTLAKKQLCINDMITFENMMNEDGFEATVACEYISNDAALVDLVRKRIAFMKKDHERFNKIIFNKV